ncbi:hypothetical protein VTN96DRAFT_8010 [Rasamsonia emersonii]
MTARQGLETNQPRAPHSRTAGCGAGQTSSAADETRDGPASGEMVDGDGRRWWAKLPGGDDRRPARGRRHASWLGPVLASTSSHREVVGPAIKLASLSELDLFEILPVLQLEEDPNGSAVVFLAWTQMTASIGTRDRQLLAHPGIPDALCNKLHCPSQMARCLPDTFGTLCS